MNELHKTSCLNLITPPTPTPPPSQMLSYIAVMMDTYKFNSNTNFNTSYANLLRHAPPYKHSCHRALWLPGSG